jgi:Coenzyme PQQ synthesis protein D (PqqD)
MQTTSVNQVLPRARTKELIIREMSDEVLIYDTEREKAHCLNQTSAFVWKHCDGKRSVEQVAHLLERAFGTDASSEVVWLALEQLEKQKLLEESVERVSGVARMTRRELGRKLGIAAVIIALPLITSIKAPTAMTAASVCIPAGSFGCVTDGDCCAPARCNTGTGQCFNP